LSGSVGPGHRLHIVAAVLADTGLLENPLSTVRTFSFLTELGGKPSAVVGTGLNIVGVGSLASGASFHGRLYNSPVGWILTEVLPQRESSLDGLSLDGLHGV
jgi:hypothetical protein